MKKKNDNSRRSFLKKLGASTAGLAVAPLAASAASAKDVHYLDLINRKAVAANDRIQVGLIGTGGMGIGDMQTALQIDGVEIVAACDLYDGRLTRAKELWGNDIQTTKDYREVIDRSDVDVIINATTDHWHEQISIDAMKQGKHIYCEKPMVQKVQEGHNVIKAQQETGVVFQVGSQYTSSIIQAKAKELLKACEIGCLVFAEVQIDRLSSTGAWQYTIPPDASPRTVDWDTYLKDTQKRDFDPLRFFRWRNYQDYGTGMAGDLYVHMLSMLHFVTDSLGPTRVMSTGGIRYWDDGRDVPDLHLGLLDYPETDQHPAFNLALRTNFISGGGPNYLFKMVGTEGSIEIGWSSLTLNKTRLPEIPGMSIGTFPEAMQEQIRREHAEKYPNKPKMQEPTEFVFRTPDNYRGDRYEHFANFFESVRTGKEVYQDATFGLRACGPTEAGNISYYEDRIVHWDPINMQLDPVV